MNVLTDEDAKEIHRVLCATVGADYLTIAKAASDFTIKKLAAGVSVEPDGWRTQEYIGAPSQQEPYYTADQLTTAIAATRVQENERCAKWLDAEGGRQESAWDKHLASGICGPATSYHTVPRGYAKKLRALLGKESV